MTSIVQNLTRYKLKKRTQDHVKVGADESTQPWSSLVEGDEGCIDPSGKLSCLWQTPQNYATHEWLHSIHMGRSICSSPSTKELHGWAMVALGKWLFTDGVSLSHCWRRVEPVPKYHTVGFLKLIELPILEIVKSVIVNHSKFPTRLST